MRRALRITNILVNIGFGVLFVISSSEYNYRKDNFCYDTIPIAFFSLIIGIVAFFSACMDTFKFFFPNTGYNRVIVCGLCLIAIFALVLLITMTIALAPYDPKQCYTLLYWTLVSLWSLIAAVFLLLVIDFFLGLLRIG